ncbi:MAG: beta-ketoacyl-[acyl-carrier-protein] synthase family protein [Gammaproteobacteria bacterium]
MVITGLGVISPLGNDPQEFFKNLLAGRSGIGRLQTPFAEKLSIRIGAQVDFDGALFFPPGRLKILDRVSQLALSAAAQAVTDAGLSFQGGDEPRCGVYLGTGMGGAQTTDAGYAILYREGSERLQPFTVVMTMNNAPAAWVALEYGLTGPCLTYSTACSSSAVAVGEAYRQIALGRIDAALAGGAEAPLTYGTMKAWEALRTLALEDPENPARSCKPFSKNRTGLVLGEGAAIVVLEDLERARSRAAPAHAELVGYSQTTDVAHITRPSLAGQAHALRSALEDSKVGPEEIDYINAHGTATLQNDAVETAAIKEVFGRRGYQIPISSTKSMHGHLLGAAGTMELIVAIMSLKHQAIPPTINLTHPDPECDLDYVANRARTNVAIATVMSNSFAFGGTNAVLIARKYDG